MFYSLFEDAFESAIIQARRQRRVVAHRPGKFKLHDKDMQDRWEGGWLRPTVKAWILGAGVYFAHEQGTWFCIGGGTRLTNEQWLQSQPGLVNLACCYKLG